VPSAGKLVLAQVSVQVPAVTDDPIAVQFAVLELVHKDCEVRQ
jgi:hypothetical protein